MRITKVYTDGSNIIVEYGEGTNKVVKNLGFVESVGSGGNCDDVRYVTFMSEDGSQVYGVKPVAVGDDCADPITRGIFNTPTKERSAEYTYTFYGWSAEPGGATDANVLKAVNENKTVYATFTSAVRFYTIRYYDGDTLLKSESLAYGAMPSYNPGAKTGHVFDGWKPELTAVSGDADYSATWIEAILFSSSLWCDIARVCEEGTASKHFKLGDTREETIGEYTVVYRIIGFDHDDLSDGSGKAGLTIMTYKTPIINLFDDKSLLVDVSKWSTSDMRTYCNETIYGMMPEDLQSVIKPVDKISSAGWDSPTLETTSDKVWIPSAEEFYTIPTEFEANYISGQGSPYEYSGKHIAYNSNTGIRLVGFWTRSARYVGGSKNGPGWYFTITQTSPYVYMSACCTSSNVVFCFCV